MDQRMLKIAEQVAAQDFQRARRKAIFHDMLAAVGRRSNWLLSFEEVQRLAPIEAQQYRGLQIIPVASIVGSVDRYRDFNRGFLPTQSHTRPRWERVDVATLTDINLPPVQLYKVGEAYFVKDGNHRVSVAKEKGIDFIDAEVIELVTQMPLMPGTDPRDLLQMAERTRFFDQTKLNKLRGDVDIMFSTLGRYDTLIEHISAHRWFMGIEQDKPIEWQEAVLDWYDNVFLPVRAALERNNILADFPNHTVGDLYLWIMDHRWYFREQTGQDMGPETGAHSYNQKYASWTRKVIRSLRKFQDAATRPLVLTGKALLGRRDE